MPFELEICIACDRSDEAVHNAKAAVAGGADRLECCAHMERGGLTPDPRIIEAIRDAIEGDAAILAMVRPRDGNFDWTAQESQHMQQSTIDMATAGADGVVSGALHGGAVDDYLTARLVDMSHERDMSFTFHRAFDAVNDRDKALDVLQSAACDRILSAGTPWNSGLSAVDGREELKRMVHLLGGSMEVVIGGGISAETMANILPELSDADNVSFHAYSSVLKNGLTHPDRVRNLRIRL